MHEPAPLSRNREDDGHLPVLPWQPAQSSLIGQCSQSDCWTALDTTLDLNTRAHTWQQRYELLCCLALDLLLKASAHRARASHRHWLAVPRQPSITATIDRPTSCFLTHCGVNRGGLGAAPSKKVKKDFCHSGESVLDLTFLRIMWDEYLK